MTVVEDLAAAIDGLVDADPAELAQGDTIMALQRQFARLDAVYSRTAATFDSSGGWIRDGANGAAAWISGMCHLPPEDARRRIRNGRVLAELTLVSEAWFAGDIDAAHVHALGRACTARRADAMARDEALLVEYAKTLHHTNFRKAVAYWIQVNDPDRAESDSADLVERRSAHVSSTLDGMVRGDFTLDPIRGAIVDETLREIYDQFFKADWAEAKARLGREPTLDELGRTPAQRRADALVEMAIRARTAPKGGKRPRPLFSVYVDYDSAMKRLCELANGTVIAPGALLPWLTEAELERVVFDGKRRVIDLGRRRRLFRGATRRAVQLRDRQCYHPLCDRPAERCQIDHVTPHSHGGETTTTNGEPACAFHNRWRYANEQRKPQSRKRARDDSGARNDDELP